MIECMSSTPVDAVVAACKEGDRDAQRLLYERHNRDIYRLMVRMVGLNDADDVTQQVFLRLLRNITQFSGRSRFETWLYRVAMNESLQFLRRRAREKDRVPLQEPADRAQRHVVDVEHRELLQHGLERIDPELRSIFLLREVEQQSYREIASILGISEGTVASRLNRARRHLRDCLIELGWEG